MRGFIDLKPARKLYVSLIHPHLLVVILFWMAMYLSGKLLVDVGVDSVRVSMAKMARKIVYRGYCNMGLPVVKNMYQVYVPTCKLRSSDQLLVTIARCHSEFIRKNIAIRGGYYWNILPFEIKSSDTIDLFKQNLKSYGGFG